MAIELTKIERDMLDVLLPYAAKGRTLFYEELNVKAGLGLDLGNPQDRKRLSDWLFNINKHESASNRPPIGAVVVLKGNPSQPGSGFFAMVDVLDLRRAGEDNDAVYSRLLGEVFAHHKPRSSTR